jgi:hypothetical protein
MLDPPEYQRLKEFVDPEFFLITSNKVILKTKDGQCVMWDPIYKNCTLHQLGVFTHGDYHYFKPRRCCLFPLVVTESGDDLEISLGSEFYRGDLPCDVRESEKTIMEICQSELEYYYPHRVVID